METTDFVIRHVKSYQDQITRLQDVCLVCSGNLTNHSSTGNTANKAA